MIMWLVGALLAACGTAVYIELGTVCFLLCRHWELGQTLSFFCIKGLPRSGGEKNYLEYIYRRPKFMVTCTFVVYTLIMASLLSITRISNVHPSSDRELQRRTVSFSVNVCRLFTSFNACVVIYSYLRHASLLIYRADMVQYTTCCF